MVKGVVDRFSEEFVETRRKALDKFLKRITDHPVLSFNEHFSVFLTAKVQVELCVCSRAPQTLPCSHEPLPRVSFELGIIKALYFLGAHCVGTVSFRVRQDNRRCPLCSTSAIEPFLAVLVGWQADQQ